VVTVSQTGGYRGRMRIIGIDPGLRKTGWGIIEANGDRICSIANGVCETNAKESLYLRLKVIFEELTKVVGQHKPDQAAVENTFVNKDASNTLKLGQARGVCMLVPALAGLKVDEYAPNAIKKAVAGIGHATKDQIKYMVKLQFPNTRLNGADATDALAVAICHASHIRYSVQIQRKLISESSANDW
tara:strand:+ start:473 stop:1033 length:561 start_codon:yes stop_codon:yes gene_type:complete